MREYKLSKGWAVFIIYICSPILLLVFGSILVLPLIPGLESDIEPSAYWVIAPVCLGMIFITVICLLDALKSKFVITNEGIYLKNVFSTKELRYHEIKGYRISDKYIFIEPDTKSKKTIKLSTYFGNTDEVISWLDRYYPDLDELNKQQENAAILSNIEFGWRSDQREAKLRRSRIISYIINTVGISVSIWTWFIPKPYALSMIACLITPLLAILIFRFSGGLFQIDDRKDSAYPTVAWAIFPPGLSLFWRAIRDFNILEYHNAFAPILALAAIIFVALMLGNNEFKFRQPNAFWAFLGIVLIVSAYSYGAVIVFNCAFDKSKAQVFRTEISNKRVSEGKTTTYYIELISWNQQTTPKEVTVPKELYQAFNIHDQAEVYIKNGQLEIPWFWVVKPSFTH